MASTDLKVEPGVHHIQAGEMLLGEIAVPIQAVQDMSSKVLQLFIDVFGPEGLLQKAKLWDAFVKLSVAKGTMLDAALVKGDFYRTRIIDLPEALGDGYSERALRVQEIMTKPEHGVAQDRTFGALYQIVARNMDRIAQRLQPIIAATRTAEQGEWSEEEKQACSSRVVFDADSEDCQITFDTIIGQEDAKTLLMQTFVQPLTYPNLFGKVGKGVILWGPPGTGKTLLAKACINKLTQTSRAESYEGVAGEACVNFIFFAPTADNLKGKYVGETEKMIRNLFFGASRIACRISSSTKKACMAVIFLDEVDNVAGDRTKAGEASNIVSSSVNALLQMLDGVESPKNVVVIAATNLLSSLDDAFKRRFSYKILVSMPKEDDVVLQLHSLLTAHVHSYVKGLQRLDEISSTGPTCRQVTVNNGQKCETLGRCAATNPDPFYGWKKEFGRLAFRCIGAGLSDKQIVRLAQQCMVNNYSPADIKNMFNAAVRIAGQAALTDGRFWSVRQGSEDFYISKRVPVSALGNYAVVRGTKRVRGYGFAQLHPLQSVIEEYHEYKDNGIYEDDSGHYDVEKITYQPMTVDNDTIAKVWSSDDLLLYTKSDVDIGEEKKMTVQYIMLQYNIDVSVDGAEQAPILEHDIVLIQLDKLNISSNPETGESHFFRFLGAVASWAKWVASPIGWWNEILKPRLPAKGEIVEAATALDSIMAQDQVWESSIVKLIHRIVLVRFINGMQDPMYFTFPPGTFKSFRGLNRKIHFNRTAASTTTQQGDWDWFSKRPGVAAARIAERVFGLTDMADLEEANTAEVTSIIAIPVIDATKLNVIKNEYDIEGSNSCATAADANSRFMCWHLHYEDFLPALAKVKATLTKGELNKYTKDK
jgi:SpoVK/Ycf46/Vps4 family AAA+-type ATPase